MKKLIWILAGILICAFLWYRWSLRAPGAGAPVVVTIEKGTSVSGIAAKLSETGQIRSPRAFTLYTRFHGVQGLLKAGAYKLDGSLGVPALVDVLTEGKNSQLTLTIPEGYTVKDIDALVAKEGLAPPGAIIDCAKNCDFSAYAFIPSSAGALAPRGGRLEGYLYPDTYFVNPLDFTPQSFLERLIGTFHERVLDDLQKDVDSSGHSLQEIITMASIMEEEANGEEDRNMVSGILWNRIDQGIGLYADATIRYALQKPKEALRVSDLETDSPYNTRKYKGLPPGPIANPGLQSIHAALHPTQTAYLYYLHDAKGVAHYAETNDEHNKNKSLYLR